MDWENYTWEILPEGTKMCLKSGVTRLSSALAQ